MKKIILLLFSTALLLIYGCKRPETLHISKVGNAEMGAIHTPHRGEGELFSIDTPLPDGFDRLNVEVIPFEHQIFRIVLHAENIPGSADALENARALVQKNFHIPVEKFQSSGDRFTLELPGTILILSRAFQFGPRAVSLEIIDRELAKTAEKIKQTAKFDTICRQQKIKQQISLIAQGLDGHKLDTGMFPEKLAHLQKNLAATPQWNGAYLMENPNKQIIYRKISDSKYELYAEVDGKKIEEDTEL